MEFGEILLMMLAWNFENFNGFGSCEILQSGEWLKSEPPCINKFCWWLWGPGWRPASYHALPYFPLMISPRKTRGCVPAHWLGRGEDGWSWGRVALNCSWWLVWGATTEVKMLAMLPKFQILP
jgi:hypothetical protein